MIKTAVYNQEGKKVDQISLPKEIFDVQINNDLIYQVLVSQRSNKRQGSAHTKNRGEVRGGGKKPWRQKGTGRARHGSIRSPIWRGGGVSGGPRKEKKFKRIISAKMRKKALFMALSEKLKNDLIIVLDSINLEKAKTKLIAEILKKIPIKNESRLILYPAGFSKVFLAARNIAKTGVLEARNLNLSDLLNYKYLIISKDGIQEIKKTFLNKAKIKNKGLEVLTKK